MAKMLCYVTRPDSVVMEVEVDAKANGEDCLNKVRRLASVVLIDQGAMSARTGGPAAISKNF